jgi:hypothetical protein
MKVIECAQYSPEWWTARRGVPTASEFGSILTAKTMKLSAAADTYICRLIADLFDFEYGVERGPVSKDMARGKEFEEESRRWYEMETGRDVKQVGFCISDCGRFGCSPDSLIGDDGALELKNPAAHTHVGYVIDGVLPSDYLAQCHGQLIVTGRAFVDFLSYRPGFPPLMVRVTPNEYTDALRAALEVFWNRYQETLKRFRPEPLVVNLQAEAGL